jgi:acetyl esterase/lipase
MTSILLWPDGTPDSLGSSEYDCPSLDIYESFGTSFQDAAVLILPGGGYEMLSAQEGEGYAGIFQLQGFKTFVLNYRLGSKGYRHPAMLNDAARALRTLRARASEFGFNPQKIVVIGSSAGGHLAATLLTQWTYGRPEDPDPIERVSSRPDLGILCYPVITMGKYAHEGSRNNLLGEAPTAEQLDLLSPEKQVTALTPPCFVWHTVEDTIVRVENAFLFSQSLQRAGVPFELHIYQEGEHGLGMKNGHPWTEDCIRWLRRRVC